MPVKSGFRPRPKAFTGARKPFNLAEAQANADSGWSRRKPEDESSQTSPTKSHSTYENVKVKVRDFFKRGPAPSLDSEREARNRQVADELFPPEEPVAIRGRRERVIEFDINSPFEVCWSLFVGGLAGSNTFCSLWFLIPSHSITMLLWTIMLPYSLGALLRLWSMM